MRACRVQAKTLAARGRKHAGLDLVLRAVDLWRAHSWTIRRPLLGAARTSTWQAPRGRPCLSPC